MHPTDNDILSAAQEIATAIENAGCEISRAIAGFAGTNNELKLGLEVYGVDLGVQISTIADALEKIAKFKTIY
jgi:hypothetical protein